MDAISFAVITGTIHEEFQESISISTSDITPSESRMAIPTIDNLTRLADVGGIFI